MRKALGETGDVIFRNVPKEARVHESLGIFDTCILVLMPIKEFDPERLTMG
jgi:hypothetical protein